MLETLRRHRRALHRIPEVGFDLPRTQAYVLAHLEGLGARVKALSPSGVLAWFDAGRAETTAFRCDMDALPIQEAAGCPFASEHPGRMHACGHDAHMATMLAFCEWLSGRVNALPCNALVIFQPAEESGGGARLIVESGALEEAWGVGTAAVVSPMGVLAYKDVEHVINDNKIGSLTQRLYDELTGIQWGKIPDTRGWIVKVC